MKKLPTDLFPPDLKQAAMDLLGWQAPAAILLKQQPAEVVSVDLLIDSGAAITLLHANEIIKLGSYRLSKRRIEFLSGRVCAKMALESYWISRELGTFPPPNQIEIINEPSGRPLICLHGFKDLPRPEISISHGGEYAAALAAQLPCGIDIQPQKANLLRVREKYCSLEELQLLNEFLSDMPPLSRLSLLWTAKEAAKKALSCRQMPGFLELELTPPLHSLANCHSLTLAVAVGGNILMPDSVTVLTATVEEYGLAMCLLNKEQ